jgi:hypothetical protein
VRRVSQQAVTVLEEERRTAHLGVLQDASQLLQVAWTQKVRNIDHRLFGKQAQRRGLNLTKGCVSQSVRQSRHA